MGERSFTLPLHPDDALAAFERLFYPLLDKQAPMKKCTVKKFRAPWIDNELKNIMVEQDVAKGRANRTGNKGGLGSLLQIEKSSN